MGGKLLFRQLEPISQIAFIGNTQQADIPKKYTNIYAGTGLLTGMQSGSTSKDERLLVLRDWAEKVEMPHHHNEATEHQKTVERSDSRSMEEGHTAFSSPKLPHLAKCALRLAFELPAATPHNARKTLEKLNKMTRGTFGSAGDKQSRIMAQSLKTSAASLYILHSGSRDVPSLWAKRMVAILPMLSCRTDSRSAAVGDADASPTPTPKIRC